MSVKIKREIDSNSIRSCIKKFSGDLNRLDLLVLLAFVLNKDKEFVLAHPDYKLSENERENLKNVVSRRLKGEPIAYITGHKEFYSLNFTVNRYTLIPRPETEHVVEEILKHKPQSLIDIGTGCGNIAISVKYHMPNCRVFATDISKEALKVAEKNTREIIGEPEKVIFYQGSFFDPVPKHLKFDIIASNPPYIKRGDVERLSSEIKDYEPIYALDGGEDGLEAYKNILRQATKRLKENGCLILEIDELILEGFVSLCYSENYDILEIVNDYAGKARVSVLSPRY